MEHDDRHLDSLTDSMIEYFNEVLIHKNCVSSTFRKYSVKNDEDVEFSFLLLRSTFNKKKPFCQIDSSSLTEEIMKITSDEGEKSDLTEHRLNLVKSAAENLLRAGGYKLRDAKEDCWVHFTTKNSSQESELGAKLKVLCGPVVNSATKVKETQITPEEYRNLRLADMEAMSESKTLNRRTLESLVDASVIVSLLQVKSSQAVTLNLTPDSTGPRETASKGGTFLQYNSTRLAAIRQKHGERVQEGLYLDTPAPEEVDFAVLQEPEEWALVFNFLLEYPSLVRRLSEEMAAGKSNVHQICDFLSKLCALFSVYYRRVRILLEPRDHLFPTIHARVLLAKSVEQVLENGLAILNINKIDQM